MYDNLGGAIRNINREGESAQRIQCDTAAGAQTTGGMATPRTIPVVVDIEAVNSFAESLAACIEGRHRITRAGWNARGQHVEAQRPDKGSRMSVPYLVLKNAQNELVPWVPSQGDLFARDWAILPR